ncbi:MAG TPA: aminotransferase class V-fold PLP-dependent enzyme [Patescibacteria group bacterium]|nr:aminotransferase class V-fold PLP-dependent enzyme [Patescibacteria group bacterium]
MNKIFFTVGPSQLYPTIPTHIKTALKDDVLSLSHRSSTFVDIVKTTHENLRKLLGIPDTHHIFFTSCALEGMERTIQNTVETNSFHFVNGSFSREFWQIAVDLKKNAVRFDADNGEGFDFTKAKIPHNTELICLIQNETSTGVAIPMKNIYNLKKQHQKKLIAVDVVSSIPYTKIDFSLIDILIFSVQKGFGLPAGLGIMIVNDKALQKAETLAEKNITIGSFHNFLKLAEFEQKFQTRETPNVLNIYLLGKVTEDMLQKGIETIRKETDEKADLLYKFFEKHTQYEPYVADSFRSQTTIVIDVKGESQNIVNNLKKKGLIVAQGYGKRKDDHIRIANFPSLTKKDIKKLLSEL